MFGYRPKQTAVTRDGPHLPAYQGRRAGGPGKPSKPGISQAAAITAVMVLKHLDARLQVLEQRMTGGGQGQSSDLDQRLAIAPQKHSDMVKEMRAEKLEETVARHEAEKQPNDNLEPADPKDDPPGAKDDRAKFGRFDPSSGDQAQKTPKHPVGDALVPMPTKAASLRATSSLD